jgi:2-aminobenzoate-CoA ligase
MRKYGGISGAHAPTVMFALPELCYPERMNTVRVLMEGISKHGWGERTAYVYGQQRITFDALRRQVHAYGSALRRLGIGPGDAVLIRIDDCPELIYAILAVQAIGAVAIPTYTQLKTDDLVFRADDASVRTVLVSEPLLAEAEPLAVRCASVKELVVVSREPSERHLSLASLLEQTAAEGETFEYADTHSDDVALILYTSGSTGRPKGCLHNHADLLAVCDTYCRYCIGLTPDDVVAGPASVPFALGYGLYALFTLRFGACGLLTQDKRPGAMLGLLKQHGATVMAAVPTYYNQLVRAMRETGETLPAGLRLSLCGGEPVAEQVADKWRAVSGLEFDQFLGTTELLHCFLSPRHGIDPVRPGAIGPAVPGYEVSVRDPETFQPVGVGEAGLLCARGPTGTRFLNRPDAQSKAVREGWSVFPDLVRRDADGYVYFIARCDDAIQSSGYTISPVEVENVLLEHPAVAECACVGAPDPKGERSSVVTAFIVLREGEGDAALGKDIQDFFKARSAPYKYPRQIIFVDSLPKTINGKILRSELRSRF